LARGNHLRVLPPASPTMALRSAALLPAPLPCAPVNAEQSPALTGALDRPLIHPEAAVTLGHGFVVASCTTAGLVARSRRAARASRRCSCRARALVVRQVGTGNAVATKERTVELLFEDLERAARFGDGSAAREALQGLKDAGAAPLFQSYPRNLPSGRRVELFDLKTVGIRSPDQLVKQPDVSYISLALSILFGLAAVFVQSAGPFVTLALLGASIGSIFVGAFLPQLLPEDPEEQQRVQAHEAAHFVVGYLLGAQICGYSIDAKGKPSVEFDERTGPLAGYTTSREALDVLCVISCAGIAGEGQIWDGSNGGAADLEQLAKAVDKSAAATGMSDAEEQLNFARWGVFYAASMLRANKASWDAVRQAMAEGADVCGCIQALEAASVR